MVDIINRLYSSMQEGRDEKHLSHIFQDLVDYVATHFVREEEIMAQYGYPGYEDHKIEHRYLTEQLHRIKNDFEKGTGGISVALLLFLRDWLVKHIKSTDKKYSEYLLVRGVS